MKIRQLIINWLERKLTCSVNPSDIFTYGIDKKTKKFTLYINGEAMAENQIRNLQEEIKFIEKSEWWKIISETVTEKAREIAFQNSTTFEDMRTSKSMLKNVRLIKEINLVVKSWKAQEIKGRMPTSPIQH